MGRRSFAGRGKSGWSAPRPAKAPLRNLPKPAAPAPPPAPVIQRGSAVGGLGSVVAEGMAFGGGSAIAHRAVDAVMGPRIIHHEAVSSAPSVVLTQTAGNSDACGGQSKAFQDCLSQYGSEISKCQFYMDMLSECRKTSTAGLSV